MDYTLHHGDCLAVLPTLPANSVDAIVTDPPYGLEFMGKDWDHGVPGVHFWAEALRVAKPGAHLLAFGGSRTYHRLAVAIEDAGWEIRDTIMWLYGSGFPKSLNVSTAIERQEISSIERQFCEWLRDCSGLTPDDLGTDRFHVQRIEIVNTATKENPRWGRRALVPTFEAWQKIKAQMTTTPPSWVEDLVKNPPMPPITHPGQWKSGNGRGTQGTGDWQGWGTALKPAHEPIIVARKPLQGTVAANVLQWGTGAINVDGCRVGVDPEIDDMLRTTTRGKRQSETWENGSGFKNETNSLTGVPANGRWPANVVHDGSAEVTRLFPVTSKSAGGGGKKTPGKHGIYGTFNGHQYDDDLGYGDTGSAARFFYCAKASKADRDEGLEGWATQRIGHNLSTNACARCGMRVKANGSGAKCECGELRETIKLEAATRNHHPTVKPTSLMRWLVRLVTPPNGVILDPFTGSGSTGKAAMLEGFRFIGIEQDAEYCEIARARIGYAVADRAFGLFDLPEHEDLALAAD